MRNARGPPWAGPKWHEITGSFKIETLFSSACSRGPVPKRQVAKVFLSGYVAIADTGKSHSSGVGQTLGTTTVAFSTGFQGTPDWQQWTGDWDPKTQAWVKGIVSSFSLYWKHLRNQILAVAVEGQLHCPVHWSQSVLFGSWLCYMQVPSRVEEERAWGLFKWSFTKIRGRNVKSVLCSSKRFIRPFILDTKSVLFECKSSSCWLVCQGWEGGRPDPGIGEWAEQWTGRTDEVTEPSQLSAGGRTLSLVRR